MPNLKVKSSRKTKTIPYHRLPKEGKSKVNAVGVNVVKFPDGRTVFTGRHPTKDGVWVVCTAPRGKNTVSRLEFRLSEEAALALGMLLLEQVEHLSFPEGAIYHAKENRKSSQA